MPPISNDWLAPLKPEFSKPYYAKLYKTINEEYTPMRSIHLPMISSMHSLLPLFLK